MKRRTTLHKRPRTRPIHRVGAPLLLAALLGGLGVMTITSDWVGRLPFHDHLILGVQHHGPVHHAHKGDELDRAFAALTVVASPEPVAAAAIPAAGQRVISLAPLSATQVELSTVSLVAGAIGAIGCALFARGRRLIVADSPCPAGHLPGLPAPPPPPS
jgi:hypothetical protein